MNFADAEYAALRQTIAARGTVRTVLLPLTFLGWASLALSVLLLADLPVAALFPLAVLGAGFEAIHALHVGVERIGRYVQVFYEDAADAAGPRWETTAMSIGPALPGGGVDPLFTALFLSAATLNLIPALLPSPTAVEAAVLGALHVLFALRVLRARAAAARQRALELESYRSLKAQIRNPSLQN